MRLSPGFVTQPNTPLEPPAPAAAAAQPSTYLDLYGLASPPFAASDAGAFLLFDSQRAAMETLVTAMLHDRGYIVLSGERDLGKTMLLGAAIPLAADPDLRILVVRRTSAAPVSLPLILSQVLGIPLPDPVGQDLRDRAARALLAEPAGTLRTVLVIDDAETLTDEALDFLTGLARHGASGSGTVQIVLVGAPDVWSLLRRPDHKPIADCVAVSLQLHRLSPAEARRYIEHRLWVAGSSVRKVMTEPALREIVERANGLPGQINALLEAAFTAGFVRGDPCITPRTLRAAIGPPRTRRGLARRIGDGPWLTLVSLLMLATGAATFIHAAMRSEPAISPAPVTEPVAEPVPPPPPPPPPSSTTEPARRADPPRPVAKPPPSPPRASTDARRPAAPPPLPPDLIAALIKRGDTMLAMGDVGAARLLYQRAAEAGSAAAATAAGMTFDPNVLARTGGYGVQPNPTLAAAWYRRALSLGDNAAEPLLRQLGPPGRTPDPR